jgi:alanyl-tRNA synthetase
MTIMVSFFNSISEFTKFVEQTITETKAALGTHMAHIEEVRKRYDKTRKRYDTLKKLTGGKQDVPRDTKQLDVAGFKVLVNPMAEYELTLLEEAISTLQDKLNVFEKTREMFPVLTDEGMKIGMVLNEGIPTGFMLYVQE